MTQYTDLADINELQRKIMRFIINRAKIKKTPIPLKILIKEMEHQSVNDFTTIKAINVLLRKGYIRRGIVKPNKYMKTAFVQLRTLT